MRVSTKDTYDTVHSGVTRIQTQEGMSHWLPSPCSEAQLCCGASSRDHGSLGRELTQRA